MSQQMIPLHIADQAVAALEAELAKVKAERDQLKADLEKSDGVVWTLAVENTHLKAELTDLKSTADRFKAEVDSLMTNPTSRLLRAEREENARFKAQVERLTKAGDELHAFLINYIVESRISSAYLNKLDDDWNAARGVQP